ncbi:MAG: hypothetical protein DMF97_03515 [Acidobacteria bacterium]|nr:MAG: hypothetical protein DMF97_03515 [Acidobacteriota bacterium]
MANGLDRVQPFMDGGDPDLSGKRLLILGGGLWQLEYSSCTPTRARDMGHRLVTVRAGARRSRPFRTNRLEGL